MLTDVGYRITFRVIIDTEAFVGESPAMLLAKHHGIALRRLRKGQHFSQPFLGTRECSANVVLIEDLDAATPLVRSWTCEIGSMFLGWDFSQVRTRHTLAADEGKLTASGGPVGRWGAARIVDGVLRIEEFEPSAALDIAFGLVYELDLNMDLDREAVS